MPIRAFEKPHHRSVGFPDAMPHSSTVASVPPVPNLDALDATPRWRKPACARAPKRVGICFLSWKRIVTGVAPGLQIQWNVERRSVGSTPMRFRHDLPIGHSPLPFSRSMQSLLHTDDGNYPDGVQTLRRPATSLVIRMREGGEAPAFHAWCGFERAFTTPPSLFERDILNLHRIPRFPLVINETARLHSQRLTATLFPPYSPENAVWNRHQIRRKNMKHYSAPS